MPRIVGTQVGVGRQAPRKSVEHPPDLPVSLGHEGDVDVVLIVCIEKGKDIGFLALVEDAVDDPSLRASIQDRLVLEDEADVVAGLARLVACGARSLPMMR